MYLDEDLREWRQTVTSFMETEVGIEYCRRCYRNRKYPYELYDALVDRGWIGLTVPESHGGVGGSQLEQMILLEALGTYGYDFGIPIMTSTTVGENILAEGTDAQIDRYIPSLLGGEIRFTIGVTEPATGSDAASLQTRAVRDSEEYIVSGEKTYQSGAKATDAIIQAYVRTNPEAQKRSGISTILIPTDLNGVKITDLPLVARKAAGTAHVAFEDVRVPADNRLGASGDGWSILSDHLIREHLGMAALMVGNAQTVVNRAADEAVDRERFGRPIAEFQAVSHRLADMQTEVDAARLLVYRGAAALDHNEGSRRQAAQAKLKAAEVLQSAAKNGMQVLGGASLHEESDMQRYWREAASATIAGGPSDIQRSIISRDVLADRED